LKQNINEIASALSPALKVLLRAFPLNEGISWLCNEIKAFSRVKLFHEAGDGKYHKGKL
jgi:hypothetical protein